MENRFRFEFEENLIVKVKVKCQGCPLECSPSIKQYIEYPALELGATFTTNRTFDSLSGFESELIACLFAESLSFC